MDISMPQFATSGRLGLYEMNHGLWVEHPFKAEGNIHMGTSMILESDQKSEDRLHGIMETSKTSDQEGNRPRDKISRRLAQNREAARKSRLRKKAYVQQLESSRLKLTQLEQELEQARQQGVYNGGNSGDSNDGVHGAFNTGAAMFEIEYSHWVEEQNRQTGALRTALQEHVPELDLRMLVENGLAHYDELFHLKASAAKSDVLHLLSGMWRTAAERLYFWIGGFRPSELLKILAPQLEPMTQQQITSVSNLRQSSQQAEDALSQGMEKLQQILAETLISTSLGASNVADYTTQMAGAMDKTEALRNFMMQADNLRQQTLHRMYRILTVRQAARGLLILGDYFQSLRALTSLWTARPC